MKTIRISLLLGLAMALLFQCNNREVFLIDDTIADPVISPASGLVAYNTKVSIDPVHTTGTLEYSLDEGKTWVNWDSLRITRTTKILTRNRVEKRVSQTVEAEYTIQFNRVLIVGNSITKHDPAPQIGWNGQWGMAASASDKDYVSYVTRELLRRNAATAFLVTNKGSVFETQYWDQFDLTLFKPEADFKPDLIIIRLGDNVEDKLITERKFQTAFEAFVSYLSGEKYQGKIIATGSFFDKGATSHTIEQVCKKYGYAYAEIGSLNTRKYTAYGQFSNNAVAMHPSDQGMEEISKRIISLF